MVETVGAGRARGEICALCGHFKMKEYPEHAKVGVGRCDGRATGRVDVIKPFLPWNRAACERYAVPTNLDDRKAWADKRAKPEQKNNAPQSKTKG